MLKTIIAEQIKASGKYRIPVSTFASAMGYCEYKVPLIAKGVRPTETEEMKSGTKIHRDAELKEEKEVEIIKLPIAEIKRLLKEGERIDFKMEGMTGLLIHGNFTYIGRMDKVLNVTQRGFEIHELKTCSRLTDVVYDGYMLQGLAYAEIARRKLGIPITKGKIVIEKQERLTKEKIILERRVTKDLIAWFYQKMLRFESLYLEQANAKHHNNRIKCLSCNPAFKEACKANLGE